MKKILDYITDFDKAISIAFICMGLGIAISLPIMFYNFSKNELEEDCVNFYKKNNYILESCEIYRDKLEKK